MTSALASGRRNALTTQDHWAAKSANDKSHRVVRPKYRCLSSVLIHPRSPAKEMNMPAVDFDVLCAEVSLEQVLNQLNYRPTSPSWNQ